MQCYNLLHCQYKIHASKTEGPQKAHEYLDLEYFEFKIEQAISNKFPEKPKK